MVTFPECVEQLLEVCLDIINDEIGNLGLSTIEVVVHEKRNQSQSGYNKVVIITNELADLVRGRVGDGIVTYPFLWYDAVSGQRTLGVDGKWNCQQYTPEACCQMIKTSKYITLLNRNRMFLLNIQMYSISFIFHVLPPQVSPILTQRVIILNVISLYPLEEWVIQDVMIECSLLYLLMDEYMNLPSSSKKKHLYAFMRISQLLLASVVSRYSFWCAGMHFTMEGTLVQQS